MKIEGATFDPRRFPGNHSNNKVLNLASRLSASATPAVNNRRHVVLFTASRQREREKRWSPVQALTGSTVAAFLISNGVQGLRGETVGGESWWRWMKMFEVRGWVKVRHEDKWREREIRRPRILISSPLLDTLWTISSDSDRRFLNIKINAGWIRNCPIKSRVFSSKTGLVIHYAATSRRINSIIYTRAGIRIRNYPV